MLIRAVRDYQLATESIEAAGSSPDLLEKAMGHFERATTAMDRVGGWDAETFAQQVKYADFRSLWVVLLSPSGVARRVSYSARYVPGFSAVHVSDLNARRFRYAECLEQNRRDA